MVAAAVLAAVVVRSRAAGLDHVAAPSMGVLLSLSFLVASLRQRAPHLLALAGVALTLGLALGALKIGRSAAYWLLIALGAAAVLIGRAAPEIVPRSPPGGGARMNELDRVIHEPARLLLVALLAGVAETDFLWLQRESGLTKGNLSSHLARLEEAGYVVVEKTFKGKIPLTLLRLTRTGRGTHG